MAERATDDDGAGDGPEERERSAVDPAGKNGEDAIAEEDAEDPRRDLGAVHAALMARRHDECDGSGGGEQQCDETVRELPGSERANEIARAGSRVVRLFRQVQCGGHRGS